MNLEDTKKAQARWKDDPGGSIAPKPGVTYLSLLNGLYYAGYMASPECAESRLRQVPDGLKIIKEEIK